MRYVEATGRSFEEAKEQALFELGATEETAVVELVEETRGFLGLGHHVKVRATLREEVAQESAGTTTEAPPAEERSASADEGSGAPATEAVSEAEAAGPWVEEVPEEGQPELAPLGRVARETVLRMVELMGMECTVKAPEVSEEEVRIELEGKDVGLLIGRHGDTLDALQLLTAVIANRRVEHGGRVLLDAENYRARRMAMLERLAIQEAQKVKETKQEVVIPDLKPYERRVVHLALRDDPQVDTYSEGEGRNRRIVITPGD